MSEISLSITKKTCTRLTAPNFVFRSQKVSGFGLNLAYCARIGWCLCYLIEHNTFNYNGRTCLLNLHIDFTISSVIADKVMLFAFKVLRYVVLRYL